MKEIDVWKIAGEIEESTIPESRKAISELINSLNGKSYNQSEMIEKIIVPMIGIVSKSNREFTVNLVQQVVTELKETTDEQ